MSNLWLLSSSGYTFDTFVEAIAQQIKAKPETVKIKGGYQACYLQGTRGDKPVEYLYIDYDGSVLAFIGRDLSEAGHKVLRKLYKKIRIQ